ncbi:MAG: HIRAN domain-containing protein [Tepidisphaeraceae bacterium]
MKTELRQLQALYLTWQDQRTKHYYPVGRLVSGLGPEQPEYEFCYLRGTLPAQKIGFAPLLAFADLHRVYRSEEIFPLFQNRLMPPGRAEYRDYLANLGVDPDHASPMDVLMRSGGGRATDSLEMVEVPRMAEEGHPFQTHFLAHGLRYLHPSSLNRIESLRPGDPLRILHDCQNEADRTALALRTEDRVLVGYMPRYLLGDAFELIQTCEIVEVSVGRVNPAPAPLQQRLLCKFEACWPPEFRPFCHEHYLPIPPDATDLTGWCLRETHKTPETGGPTAPWR